MNNRVTTHTTWRKVASAISVMAALLAAVWSGAGVASAHAKLVSSTPAQGATVQPGLTTITLTFNEEISVDQSLAELEGNGSMVQGATASVDRASRKTMTITTSALQAGSYTIKWKAVTEDDNGITNGTLSFTVAAGGGSSQATATPEAMGQGGQDGQGGQVEGSLPGAGVPDTLAAVGMLGAAALCLLMLGVAVLRRSSGRV